MVWPFSRLGSDGGKGGTSTEPTKAGQRQDETTLKDARNENGKHATSGHHTMDEAVLLPSVLPPPKPRDANAMVSSGNDVAGACAGDGGETSPEVSVHLLFT